jgi:hypothetical protein
MAEEKELQRKRLQERNNTAIDKRRKLMDKIKKPTTITGAAVSMQPSKLALPPVDQNKLSNALLMGKSAATVSQNQPLPNGPPMVTGKPLRVATTAVKVTFIKEFVFSNHSLKIIHQRSTKCL